MTPQHHPTPSHLPLTATVLSALLLATAPLPAGPLVPPAGTPTASMRTLNEIEPRIPLSTASLQNGSLYLDQPGGNYYFTENINCTPNSQTALIANVENVHLDLNGFELTATNTPGTPISGVSANGTGFSISNGTVRGMTDAITVGHQATLQNLRVLDSGSSAIRTGDDCRLTACNVQTLRHNTGCNGIIVGARSILTHCTVADLQNSTNSIGCTGIRLSGPHSTASDCQVWNLVSAGSNCRGIASTTASTIRNCSVHFLSLASGTGFTSLYGIDAGSDSTITDCDVASLSSSVPSSSINAISVGDNSSVSHSQVRTISIPNTVQGGTCAGIYTATRCQVSHNHVANISVATDGFVHGIFASNETTVEHNTINAIHADLTGSAIAIRAFSGSTIASNTVTSTSAISSPGNAISASANYVRILSNSIRNSSTNDIHFAPSTTHGYAAANLIEKAPLDQGTNTEAGTTPAPNATY